MPFKDIKKRFCLLNSYVSKKAECVEIAHCASHFTTLQRTLGKLWAEAENSFSKVCQEESKRKTLTEMDKHILSKTFPSSSNAIIRVIKLAPSHKFTLAYFTHNGSNWIAKSQIT